MIDFTLIDACAKSWPARPSLNVAEFPCSLRELDEAIDWHMWLIEPLMEMPRG
jgi:hypothetical protein